MTDLPHPHAYMSGQVAQFAGSIPEICDCVWNAFERNRFCSHFRRDDRPRPFPGGLVAGPPVFGGVFTDDMIDAYLELKMAEVARFEMTPHAVEFDMYYSV